MPDMQLRNDAKSVPKAKQVGGRMIRLEETPKVEPPPPRSLDREDLEACTQANASTPLLSLPQEIKFIIYGFVIGEEVIHIEEYKNSSRVGYCNFICRAEIPRLEDNEQLTPEDIANMAPKDKSEWLQQMWEDRHAHCYGKYRRWQRHPLRPQSDNSWEIPSLLLLSRHFYAEARLIHYSTCTIDFASPFTFEAWIRTLSPAQVAAVRKIQVSDPGISVFDYIEPIGSLLGRLKGVRNVELEMSCWEDFIDNDAGYLRGLRRAEQLELGAATLIIRHGSRQIASFTGTKEGGVVRSITTSELWG